MDFVFAYVIVCTCIRYMCKILHIEEGSFFIEYWGKV